MIRGLAEKLLGDIGRVHDQRLRHAISQGIAQHHGVRAQSLRVRHHRARGDVSGGEHRRRSLLVENLQGLIRRCRQPIEAENEVRSSFWNMTRLIDRNRGQSDIRQHRATLLRQAGLVNAMNM